MPWIFLASLNDSTTNYRVVQGEAFHWWSSTWRVIVLALEIISTRINRIPSLLDLSLAEQGATIASSSMESKKHEPKYFGDLSSSKDKTRYKLKIQGTADKYSLQGDNKGLILHSNPTAPFSQPLPQGVQLQQFDKSNGEGIYPCWPFFTHLSFQDFSNSLGTIKNNDLSWNQKGMWESQWTSVVIIK